MICVTVSLDGRNLNTEEDVTRGLSPKFVDKTCKIVLRQNKINGAFIGMLVRHSE